MTRAQAASARFRQRKLSTRQPLLIVREDQVQHDNAENHQNVPKVETGVEKAEEIVSLSICASRCLSSACLDCPSLPFCLCRDRSFPRRSPSWPQTSKHQTRDTSLFLQSPTDPSHRNIISKLPFPPPRPLLSVAKSLKYTSPPLIPSRVPSSMTTSTPSDSPNRRPLSASPPPWRIASDARTI